MTLESIKAKVLYGFSLGSSVGFPVGALASGLINESALSRASGLLTGCSFISQVITKGKPDGWKTKVAVGLAALAITKITGFYSLKGAISWEATIPALPIFALNELLIPHFGMAFDKFGSSLSKMKHGKAMLISSVGLGALGSAAIASYGAKIAKVGFEALIVQIKGDGVSMGGPLKELAQLSETLGAAYTGCFASGLISTITLILAAKCSKSFGSSTV